MGTTSYERLLDAIRDTGNTVIDNGTTAKAQCPGHDDHHPSLSVKQTEGRTLLHCHAGCANEDIMAAVNLTMADLFDDRRGATYIYPDDRQVHRTADKKFRQSGNTKGRALFHADRIGNASLVYVVEGEEDVHAVESTGAVAVTSAMGAGKAKLSDWTPLYGRRVIIVADRDEVGLKHAAQVAELLDGKCTNVQILQSAVGKDVSHHLAAGKALTELVPASDVDKTPRLWAASSLKPATQPRWLAKGRLPRAAISLLVGDEGIGKSLLWVYIVAAVTTGKPLPDFGIPERDPGHVVLVVTEDDWTTTVLPRLQVAGADLSMISVICTEDDGSGAPVFPRDLYLIHEADPVPVLVVVDAWLDTVPAMLKVSDPQQARQALHPWKELATVTDAAVLLLCHTNRVSSPNARDRYGATAELRKKARMTLYAQTDDDGRLIVGPEKMNTAAPIPASAFTITSVQKFTPTEDSDGTVPLLSYVGQSNMTAREHLADNYDADHGTDPQDREEARRWLEGYLMENPGDQSKDVKAAAKLVGISERTLARARKDLGVIVDYVGQPPTSTWTLPANNFGDDDPGDSDAPRISGSDPYIGGTTGTAGTTAGHSVMPVVPDGSVGTTVAQRQDQRICQQNPVVPAVPHAQGTPVIGGITDRANGHTDRVAQALAKARAATGAWLDVCPVCHLDGIPAGHAMHPDCERKASSDARTAGGLFPEDGAA